METEKLEKAVEELKKEITIVIADFGQKTNWMPSNIRINMIENTIISKQRKTFILGPIEIEFEF